MGVTERKISEKQKLFYLLSSRIKPTATLYWNDYFLLPRAAEIKELPFPTTSNWTDLD